MELPDFSSLWEANDILEQLKESLRDDRDPNNRRNGQRPPKKQDDTYYSDGICGVSFGIAKPEFANPLATCCEMNFFTEEELERHRSEHVPCSSSGCELQIHPSMLAFHLEVDHAKDNKNSKAAQEISDPRLQRWREQRRKCFPTFERVQAKIREVGYRIERGQVILTPRFGSLNKRRAQDLRSNAAGNKRAKVSDTASTAGSTSNATTTTTTISPGDTDIDLKPSTEPTVSAEVPPTVAEKPVEADGVEGKETVEDELTTVVRSIFDDDVDSLSGVDENPEEDQDELAEKEKISDVDEEEAVGEPGSSTRAEEASESSSSSSSEEEDDGEEEAEAVSGTANGMLALPPPLVNYDSDVSWSEALPDEGEKDLSNDPQPASPLKGKNLIEELKTFQPKNAAMENFPEGVEGPSTEQPSGSSLEQPTRGRSNSRRGSRWNRHRRGGRGGRGRFQRRRGRNERATEEKDEGAGDPSSSLLNAAEAELDAEVDEEVARSGTRAFAAHPVVQMAARRRACMRKAATIAKRPTLLQMLLAEEMRHERNQLMQCVRYVVRNNFFLPEKNGSV